MFDVLYTNGLIHTMDPARPAASAIGVHGGRVISLDYDIAAEHFTTVYDLRGRAVVPGFNDAHCHLSMIGLAELQVDLRPETAPDMESLLVAVKRACETAEPGEWVLGAGYDQHVLQGRHPTAEEIDAVSGDHPVWLTHRSRHMGVGNTAAFELAGFGDRRGMTVPDGGEVPLDAEGRALGVLLETAQALVRDRIPAPNVDDIADMVAAGSRLALSQGITSITEPGLGAPDHIGHTPFDLAGYQQAQSQGRLGVRATVMPYLTTLHELHGWDHEDEQPPLGLDLGVRTGMGDPRLRIGATKILADGSLIGRSAYMCCDYNSPGTDGSSSRGVLQFPRRTLRDRIVGAHRAGWQVAAHAIGDAALDVVMDIFEEAQRRFPRPDPRHRIEHVNVATDRQLTRMRTLGLVPVPQGRFVTEIGDSAAQALGEKRTPLAYRMRGFLEAGLPLPASTDAPVVALNPMLNLEALVTRRTASGVIFQEEERITVEQALRAYTVGSAYASGEEHLKGTLSPGKLADFVVLDDDPLTVAPDELGGLTAEATVVGGALAHGDLTRT